MNRAILSAALLATGVLASAACAGPSSNAGGGVAVNPNHKGGAVVTVSAPTKESERPYALTGQDAAAPAETRKATRYEPIYVGSRIVGQKAVDEAK